MLRIHLLQQFFGHSDPAMEEALHDIPLYREFAQLDAGITRLPDESTILRFSHAYLAGAEFTAADIMSVFSLTTMRYFFHWDLSPYGNILKYLKLISDRPAYQRAMKKGDPNMSLLLT